VQEWSPRVPDLQARPEAGGTVAELGCGEGRAAIALAVGYPNLIVDAFDIDPPVHRGGPPPRGDRRRRRPDPLRVTDVRRPAQAFTGAARSRRG
jgi:hypothetical protein